MLAVERWAEIRRLALVEGLSQREIRRRTGAGRDTIRKAVASPEPPSYSPRPKRPSKLDPYRAEIERLLDDEPTLSGVRILEEIQALGYSGGQTILDVALRELRPRYLPLQRTFQRPSTAPASWPSSTSASHSRRFLSAGARAAEAGSLPASCPTRAPSPGALIFSKEFADIGWGVNRCLARLGALPKKLVWDREGAIHAGGGHPTGAFAAYCGTLGVG